MFSSKNEKNNSLLYRAPYIQSSDKFASTTVTTYPHKTPSSLKTNKFIYLSQNYKDRVTTYDSCMTFHNLATI